MGATAVGALAAAFAVAAFLAVSSPGVESAEAAFTKAATVTAASARQSGTATVHMTHDGQFWAHKVVRWNGPDVEITEDNPSRAGTFGLVVVGGILYGPDGDGGWLELGNPSSIDPDSGMTPTEYLAAVREDVGGSTLRRIVAAMTASGLMRMERADGSTVYGGNVPSGQLARETGFKEGHSIRVFPFGYVANDAAADPAFPLDTTVTVDSSGVIHEIAVTWGTWTYAVTYSALGSTPAPAAPAHAKSLEELRHPGAQP